MATVFQTNRDSVASKDRAVTGAGAVTGPTPDNGGPVPAGVTDLAGLNGADDLKAIEALAGTGLLARTASNAWATRTLTAPAEGLVITNPAGIAGNPTFSLANDLAALEELPGTGYAQRTGDDEWTLLESIPAGDISYDPTTSGLTATDVQAALDELAASGSTPTAADVSFDPSATSLLSTNVQDALGELDLIVQGKADISSLAAVAFSGDYNDLSNQVDLSGYAEIVTLAPVAFSGDAFDLTSLAAVGTTGQASDVAFSSGAGLSSTDVSSALDELYGMVSGGGSFDQSLNTTDTPQFAALLVGTSSFSAAGVAMEIANTGLGTSILRMAPLDAASTSNFGAFDVGARTTTQVRAAARLQGGFTDVTDATRTGYFAFSTPISATFAERMRISGQGNLLMGTTSDTGLTGAGNIRANAAFLSGSPSGGTAKPFKVGNAATVSPTSPNRTIEMEIAGTTYYLHAKTTNN